MPTWDNPLITIIGEKCRMCYACVRECPAKAIRVVDGQASVIQPRCIGCGNCLRVCTQNAKQVRDVTERAFSLLESDERVAPCWPHIAASSPDIPPERVLVAGPSPRLPTPSTGGTRADLVAHMYRRLLDKDPDRRLIASACPAVVSYVRKYQPQLMAYLAPVVSPMTAMARVLHHDHGDDLRVVFIGPCVAKKRPPPTPFIGDRRRFPSPSCGYVRQARPDPEAFPDDALRSAVRRHGTVFPISGGLLQTAGLQQDLLNGEMIVAEGRDEFIETINEFDLTHADARLLDVLSCHGCYAGPGMTSRETMLQRRTRVSNYAKNRLTKFSDEELAEIQRAPEHYADLNLYRAYVADYQPVAESATYDDIQQILHHMGKFNPEVCSLRGLRHRAAWNTPAPSTRGCRIRHLSAIHHRAAPVRLRGTGGLPTATRRGAGRPERSTKVGQHGQPPRESPTRSTIPPLSPLLHANLLLEEAKTTRCPRTTWRRSSTKPTAASASSPAC